MTPINILKKLKPWQMNSGEKAALEAYYDLSRRYAENPEAFKVKPAPVSVLPRERRTTKAERDKLKPGRFWARSSAGVMLNQRFTIGWGGVNPARPGGTWI